MKGPLLLLPLFLCFVASSWAQSPLSAASKLKTRHEKAEGASLRHLAEPEYYQAFITVDNQDDLDSLRRQGIVINSTFNGFVSARIPAELFHSSSNISGARHISLAQPMQLHNDSARYLTAVDQVHSGIGLPTPLTGKDVIVGVIDTGIDFNHINLCGKDGRSRVLAVYMPHDSTGTRPVVQGDTLPGSCYETPESISQLTADDTGSSHGTHTTGTAAGGYKENGWSGVAPEADIVACGMPSDEFTDVNIANAVKYIFDYADRVGKPCVINMSIGDNFGPNDGSSYLCKVYESVSGPGHICVLSAGNDGDAPICFHHTLTSIHDTVTTLFKKPFNGLPYQGYVSMWSNRDQIHYTRIVSINSETHEVEYLSPLVGYLPEDSVLTISSDNDTSFASLFTGTIMFANAMEPHIQADGKEVIRFHSYWDIDATPVDDTHLLGVQYSSSKNTNLVGWASKSIYFSTYGIDGAVGGSTFGSISDLATTDSVISVGAYCSRASYISKTGSTIRIGKCYPSDIAYFSSYGPDENGIPRPDVCAPGMSLISSANRYNDVANRDRWPASVFVNGEEYPYYSNQGTSMSAPVVTGTIALMLQLNPLLSTSAVRDVFKHTSISDTYVTDGEPAQWGAGKLNAQAAIDYVINNTLMLGDVNHDQSINVGDLMAAIGMILDDRTDFRASDIVCADLDRDGKITINDINRIIDIILK